LHPGEHDKGAQRRPRLWARAYGLRNPVAVISNGINLPNYNEHGQKVEGRTTAVVGSSSKVLLFLARVHPKKGLAELIEGWRMSAARRNGWMLEIASWGDGKHEARLRAYCERLGLRSSVSWLGPQYGADLATTFKRASAFILPSFSEGLPMAVLTAWAYGRPVLMTPHCNLPEGFAAQAALAIDPEPDSIAKGLWKCRTKNLLQWDAADDVSWRKSLHGRRSPPR
jgi:glycosyltransferase involved in cell wall biosynthesis